MQDRIAINRALGQLGLGQLEEGAGLLKQLAFLVEDHDHFRQMLMKCEPELRREMYESLRSYLRFAPHSLDQYLSDAARIANERQWPTQGADGKLHPFRVPEVSSGDADADLIAGILNPTLAEHHLHLVCRKCTREAWFHGIRKADAVFEARQKGWSYDEIAGDGREICPECPATRNLTTSN